MTDFRVTVVRLGKIEKHPNADRLSITKVFDGFPCIIKTGDFQEGDLAVYVPVDTLVPLADPRFAFLKKSRIRAVRLRGVYSEGLLVPADADMREGEDVAVRLGIAKWEEPPEPAARTGGGAADTAAPPEHGDRVPFYDIENVQHYPHVLKGGGDLGESVVITEKVHGANCAFLWDGRRLHVKTRRRWIKEGDSDWWEAVRKYFPRGCWWRFRRDQGRRLPVGLVLFAEVYGRVQHLRYGLPLDVDLVVFDAFDLSSRTFYDHHAMQVFADWLGLPTAPVLYRGPWLGLEAHRHLAEGPTKVWHGRDGDQHTREGFVVRPVLERRDDRIGRVILKLAGQGYRESQK